MPLMEVRVSQAQSLRKFTGYGAVFVQRYDDVCCGVDDPELVWAKLVEALGPINKVYPARNRLRGHQPGVNYRGGWLLRRKVIRIVSEVMRENAHLRVVQR